ncbi:MAG: hypothetical protein MJ211_00615 [Bacteroidales bacterium]|nr:hypothetical protein [Bacteroidales bacterium]
MAKTEVIKFDKLPESVAELEAMPQASMTNPFEVAALVVAVLCHYEKDAQTCIDMINFLKGPQPLSPYDKQFLKDRLVGKYYVPRSYFAGTSPQNNYQPTMPYTVTVSDNPYSYQQENYVTLWLKSSGADSPRQIQMRKKGDQWFLWQNMLLPSIRIPAAEDPWA